MKSRIVRARSVRSLLLLVVLLAGIGVLLFTLIGDRARYSSMYTANSQNGEEKKFIKWVDFNIPLAAMEKALNYDIKAHNEDKTLNWIELLALTGTKYSGNWKNYKARDMDEIAKKLLAGDSMEKIRSSKYYEYFFEVYDTVLHEFVGEYSIEEADKSDGGLTVITKKYGLKNFLPIAKGYSWSHSDDFGNGRSYGYKRKHLGNDLMGSIGTPVIAVESGTVEELGWNKYGGWRIGIRSFDKKRYYYYAHLRKNHPFNPRIKKGEKVSAGDVIGYMGMTGYSTEENVDGMQTPHLHFGLQLIFDESQKEGSDEIWVDVYQLVNLLKKNSPAIVRDDTTKDYYRKSKLLS